jgi:LemA protein
MKNITLWIVLGVLALLLFVGCGTQRTLVDKEQAVEKSWADVEAQYQRRLNLIDNLVNTVKGAADFEKSTLTDVIAARASATQVKIDPSNLTPEKLQEFQAAQGQVSSSLSRLLVAVEAYPNLKATQNFSELQSQLEGTENRIAVAVQTFNGTVQEYESYRKRFPNNMMAGIMGFEKKGYFDAVKGAEVAPKVDFDKK